MQVFMELFSRSTTPSQSHTLEGSTGGGAGGETGSKMQKGRKGWASILGLCGHSPFTLRWLETHLERTQSVAVRIILLVLFFLDVSGRNFGQVVFCNNPITGLIVFIGMLISSPILGLAGILSSTISIIFALATNHPREGLTCGGAGFNAILFGVVMKAIVLNSEEKIEDVEAVTWITICVGAAFTVILTNGLGSLLGSASPPVPCLSLPFNLTAVVATLTLTFINELPGHEGHQGDRNLNESAALLNHTSVDIESYDDIDYSLGSLLGMGQVAAINDITCSALIIVGMLIFSPLLTLTAFLGSLFSTFVAAHLSSSLLEFAYNGLMGYNGVLTACAVMFFLVPCTTSILINLVAVLATLLVQIAFGWAFNDISLPYFSLPFVVVCLSVLGVRGPPRPAVLTFPEHHIAQWKESAVTLSAPMASLSLVSLSQQSAHSSTLTDSRWRRTPSL